MKDDPVVSLSLDLDDKWTYLKTHGDVGWSDYPSYLSYAVPRIVDFLADRDIRITFFIVGRDASDLRNREALQLLPANGHEIANHSFEHDPWLHLYSSEELHSELGRAEDAIGEATGAGVEGFRGPGFSTSEATLKVLAERGYRFDATAFPNLLNPLARAYFLARSELDEEELERRKGLFGSYTDAFRPVKPYRWILDGQPLLEIPVTTMPVFRIPIHFSYLLYLGGYSSRLARMYLRFALEMCRVTGTEPSLLLHPLDFLGGDDEPDLAFFPAMSIPSGEKIALMGRFFDAITARYRPITMGQHASRLEGRSELPAREPDLRL